MSYKIKNTFYKALIAALTITSFNASAAEEKIIAAEDTHFYIGANLGYSQPVVKKFKYKDPSTKLESTMKIDGSQFYEVKLGYSFYPGMSAELAFAHKPSYKLTYILPRVDKEDKGVYIPSKTNKTKVTSNSLMMNLQFDFQELESGITPYVTIGAGISRVAIKKRVTSSAAYALKDMKVPLPKGGTFDVKADQVLKAESPYHRLVKKTRNCFAYQAGLGFRKNLNENISIDFGAKLKVINDVQLHYDNNEGDGWKSQKPIKKMLGIGEFSLGLVYKF